MRATDTVRAVQGTIQRESDKAILIAISSIGDRPFKKIRNEWFPFSQVSKIFRDPNQRGADYIIASEWIIAQKGLMGKDFYVQPSDFSAESEVEREQNEEVFKLVEIDGDPAF